MGDDNGICKKCGGKEALPDMFALSEGPDGGSVVVHSSETCDECSGTGKENHAGMILDALTVDGDFPIEALGRYASVIEEDMGHKIVVMLTPAAQIHLVTLVRTLQSQLADLRTVSYITKNPSEEEQYNVLRSLIGIHPETLRDYYRVFWLPSPSNPRFIVERVECEPYTPFASRPREHYDYQTKEAALAHLPPGYHRLGESGADGVELWAPPHGAAPTDPVA